jgi:heme/copper-type cytochrome/quinol oxidase subunit 2
MTRSISNTSFTTDLPIEGITQSFTQLLSGIIVLYAVTIIITLICGIINGFLWYQAFDKLGEKSGIDKFKTAGLLYLIGIFVPIIVTWIAWIFAAKGYKQLKPQQPHANNDYNTSNYTSPPVFDKIFCSQCGTENFANDVYCKHCGQPIQITQTNTTT